MMYNSEKKRLEVPLILSSLGNDTEIKNPKAIKMNELFKGEFAKCITGFNSVDEIFSY